MVLLLKKINFLLELRNSFALFLESLITIGKLLFKLILYRHKLLLILKFFLLIREIFPLQLLLEKFLLLLAIINRLI